MNKLSITVVCLMFVTCLACAQSSLDDIDRRAWHDAVSPLQMKAAGMYPLSVKKIKPSASDRVQSLGGIWTLSGADSINSDISVACRVPGSIHTALKEAAVFPTRAWDGTIPLRSNGRISAGMLRGRFTMTVQ